MDEVTLTLDGYGYGDGSGYGYGYGDGSGYGYGDGSGDGYGYGYGDGCGDGYGIGRADSHPEAKKWDDPAAHVQLVHDLNANYDCWAIALTVHSLSTYLSAIETDSRNGIRVLAWIKPAAVTSGSRITNNECTDAYYYRRKCVLVAFERVQFTQRSVLCISSKRKRFCY